MSEINVRRRCACLAALSVMVVSAGLFANSAKAVTTYNFDVDGSNPGFGVVTGTTYDWDDVTNGGFWSNNTTSTTGNIATNGWVQGQFPKFQPAGTPTYTVNVSNDEQIAGIFASTAQTLTINAIGSGDLNMAAGLQGVLGGTGVTFIINAPIIGTGKIQPSNGGTIKLLGANTYSGGTNLSSTATLVYFNSSSSFGTGDINMGVAGFAPLLGTGGATITIPNNFTSTTVTGAGINFAADAATPVISTGTWTLGANNLVLRNNGISTSPLTLSGVISGTAGITLSANNSGTIIFSGNNTYSGGTTISAGTTPVILQLGSSGALGTSGTISFTGGTLQWTSFNTTDYSNRFSSAASQAYRLDTNNQSVTLGTGFGGTSGTLTKLGAGTLTLSVANSYTGTTTVSAGTLAIGDDGSLGSGQLTLGGGTIASSGGARTIANTTIISTGNGTVGGADNFTFGGSFTNSTASRTLTVSNSGTTTFGTVDLSEATGTGRTLTITGAGNITFGGVIENFSGGGGTAGGLTFNSTYTGTATINGTNTYSGTTTLSKGTFVLGNKSAFGTGTVAANGVSISASTDLSGTSAIGNATVNFGGNNTFTGSNNIEFSGTVTETASRTVTNNMSAGSLTFSGPVNLSSNATNNTLTVTGTGNTSIGGAIANGGTSTASNLTKSGAGALTLTAANTYSGTTRSGAGTLNVNNSLALQNTTLDMNTADTGSVAFGTANSTLGSLTGSRNLLLPTGTLSVGNNNGSPAAYSGILSGSGSNLSKIGTGTTILSGANTYSGATTVSAGVLTLSGATASLGTGSVTVQGTTVGTALQIQAGVTNAIADSALLNLLGGGTAGVADQGYADLGTGINEFVGSLQLNGVAQPNGTYGATGSGATHIVDEYFAGTGILTVGPAGLPGDFNSDGKVDAGDYVTWKKNQGTNNALANDNGLGTPIGTAHYDLWRANFGNGGPGSGSGGGLGANGGTVPEPSSLVLLMLSLAALAGRRLGHSLRRC
jgi:fibronectin-binding autotransporter adhesin